MYTFTHTQVGHNLRADAIQIVQHFYLSSRNIADTEVLARILGLGVGSLRGLAAMFLGWRLSKNQARSNWERNVLSPAQLTYAATDAWASLKVYTALLQ